MRYFEKKYATKPRTNKNFPKEDIFYDQTAFTPRKCLVVYELK